jgi:hypothetical protein
MMRNNIKALRATPEIADWFSIDINALTGMTNNNNDVVYPLSVGQQYQ